MLPMGPVECRQTAESIKPSSKGAWSVALSLLLLPSPLKQLPSKGLLSAWPSTSRTASSLLPLSTGTLPVSASLTPGSDGFDGEDAAGGLLRTLTMTAPAAISRDPRAPSQETEA